MRVFFAGTPQIALPSLRALAGHHQVVGVLVREDQPEGRHRVLTAPPVKVLARELSLPILQPSNLDSEAVQAVKDTHPELLVVFAYGKIFRSKFLDIFPEGAINVHPSALPKYRGPSPLAAALLAGDSEYAITVQRVALKMDSGDILQQRFFPVEEEDTCGSLSVKVAQQAPELLLSVLESWGKQVGVAQSDDSASYCTLVRKKDGLLDWNLPAEILWRRVKAYHPWPGSFGFVNVRGRRERWMVGRASPCPPDVLSGLPASEVPGRILGCCSEWGLLCQTGEGVLGLQRLQRQNRRELDAMEFARGLPGGFDGLTFVNGVGD